MSRGRHARPSPVPRYARNTGAGGLATLSLMMTGGQEVAQAAPATDQQWAAIIDCESGGQNIKNPNSSASGYFQIINSTWEAYGGLEFAPTAMGASYDQQFIVAQRIYAGAGDSFRDWNASRDCWEDRMNTLPAFDPPDPAPPAPPEPPADDDTDIIPIVNEYRVVEGDTLADIAARTGVTVRELMNMNRIDDPDLIYVDQILLLPPMEQDIVVQEGDWISTIAQDLGLCLPEDDITTCWQPLYDQNADVVGPNPDVIVPGQVLHFVGGLPLTTAPVPVAEATPAPPPPPPAVPTVAPGGYAFPLAGNPRVGDGLGAGRGHQGQDFAIAAGTPVLAAHDGYVDRADNQGNNDGRGSAPDNGGYGNLVELTTPDGLMTRYAHLATITVQEGTFVIAGQQIGTVGSTGDSSGDHLHFEVRDPNLGVLDPLTWLAGNGVPV